MSQCIKIVFFFVMISPLMAVIGINPPLSSNEQSQIKQKINLGGWLFYETKISANNSMSCASCHKKQFGFGDTLRFNEGIHGDKMSRNTIALTNLAYSKLFFWDGRIKELSSQVSKPITNVKELDSNFPSIIKKLKDDHIYCQLFAEAFGSQKIDSIKIIEALSAFVNSLTSFSAANDSLTDHFGSLGYNLQAAIDSSVNIYSANTRNAIHLCLSCHSGREYGGSAILNNGLPVLNRDSGLYQLTKKPTDIGSFKVPTLRNVAVTYPYMHDGRFRTLDQVIDYYDHEIKLSEGLDPRLQKDGDPIKLHLSPDEKKEIIHFLESLTDKLYLTAPSISIK